jgi:hypothetical protein
MLEFGKKTLTIDGITVFSDHADPNQFWYLPGPVQIARRPPDNKAAFTLIKYGNIKDDVVTGKGFLMVELNLRLNSSTESKILAQLSSIALKKPKLSIVPFDEGTVQCIALDLQGSGGTVAQVAAPGTFQAVETILGATTPSLHGDNSAAFSLTLSKEGANILASVFGGGGAPIGAIYDLTFTGLRPALEVEITANFKRIYEHFSASLEAQIYFVKVGIDAGFEKLVQDGVIKIKVINFSTEANKMEQEKWALDFFKEKLLTEWFTPTLAPSAAQNGAASSNNASTSSASAASGSTTSTSTPASTGTSAASGSTTSTSTPASTGTSAASGSTTSTSTPASTGASASSGESTSSEAPPATGTPATGTPATGTPATGTPATGTPTTGTPTTGTPTTGTPATGTPTTGTPPATGTGNQGGEQPQGATPGNTASVNFAVSFKLKFLKQIEDKTISFKFNRAEAVRRTYAPQGFFGLLTQDLSKQGHFFEVDGDDPFFREFKVSVESPFDKQRIGLTSAHIKLDYGKPQETSPKHKDFIIDATSPEKQLWTVKMIPGINQYKYQVQYHFSPDTQWEGEKLSYDLPAILTEDRTLMIHPFDQLGFLELEISPALIDWSVVSNVEVNLQYQDSAGWKKKKTILFTETTNEVKFWKLRLTQPESKSYAYAVKYQLKDGNKRSIEVKNTEATKLAIPNPFYLIDIEFIPLFEIGTVQTIFIDLEYDDPANAYKVQKRIKIEGTKSDSVNLKLNIIDDTKREFRYRLTIIGTNNSMLRKFFIKTVETLIGISLTESTPLSKL